MYIFRKFLLFTVVFPIGSTSLARTHQRWQRKSFEDNPYWHKEILDPNGKYQLEWLVDWERERLEFNVTVETNGYVALGLAKNQKMEGADIVIGGVSQNGKPYFSDQHAIGNQEPEMDASQNWLLHSAWESRTHTFLSFSRPFDTCDEQDIPINDDALYVIWAYGPRDTVSYHFENRGSFITYLRDADVTPRVIHDSNQNVTFGGGKNTRPVVEHIGKDIERWPIRQEYQLTAKKTTYWCTVHKFAPTIPGKHHIIGNNIRMSPETPSRMHHMILARCRPPPGVDPATLYESFVGAPGEECYDMTHPLGSIPTMFCTDILSGYAVGSKTAFHPGHVGVPIGDTNSEEYFILQVHYDNPELRSGLMGDINLDVYYTSKLREEDAGLLMLGHNIPGPPSILLPPGEKDHKIYGHCASSCTREMIPPQGIRILHSVLHSHYAATRMRVQHFRNGRELPWIMNDDNYQPNFQPVRLLKNEVVVLPGDQVSIQCQFDTTKRNGTTIGGYGTEYEMCTTFLLYYNRMVEFPSCRSEIISPEYTSRYLAGIRNVTWDQSRLEYVATEPQQLAGMTLSEISDSEYVHWDAGLKNRLGFDHVAMPQVAICPCLSDMTNVITSGGSAASPPPDVVAFPLNAHPYLSDAGKCTLKS